MSKLNQSLKQELLRATKPKKLFLRAWRGNEGKLPIYKVDTDCKPPEGDKDEKYCYAFFSLFTDDKTIELNKFLSRDYNFDDTHGCIYIHGRIGFRRRKSNDISIDLSSLVLQNILFKEHRSRANGLLDRSASEDLLQAITNQLQSTEYRADAIDLLGRVVASYESEVIPF